MLSVVVSFGSLPKTRWTWTHCMVELVLLALSSSTPSRSVIALSSMRVMRLRASLLAEQSIAQVGNLIPGLYPTYLCTLTHLFEQSLIMGQRAAQLDTTDSEYWLTLLGFTGSPAKLAKLHMPETIIKAHPAERAKYDAQRRR